MSNAIHTTIAPAGFIVTDNEAIWSTGATADEAWANMVENMRQAGITVVDELAEDETGDIAPDQTLASGFVIRSATAQLIADVDSMGGAIGWHMARGVACTRTEYEEG